MESKFKFFEVVRVISKIPRLKNVYGVKGPVLGKSQDDDGSWYYGVSLLDQSWFLGEKDLESTGEFISKSEIYTGDYLTITVNQDGLGEIKKPENYNE